MKGGVDLPLLFLSHLEVTQASSLHTPQLAKTEKGSQEQSTEGEKGLNSPARCFKMVKETQHTVYCVWTGVMEGVGQKEKERCLKISELF